MNIGLVKTIISRNIRNMGGWKTNRKLVIFESDDWGSIRMPSRAVYEKAMKLNYPVHENIMERFDSLESEGDLVPLFDLLKSFKDRIGNHPVFTANCLVANPDFEKIKEDGFNKYHFELVTETFRKYPKHSGSFALWKEGLSGGVFFPQSHGREHLNVHRFINDLKANNRDAHFGFSQKMPGSISLQEPKKGNLYVETLYYQNQQEKQEKLNTIIEGLEIFEDLLGYKSGSFTPPNFIWSHDFDKALADKGVRFFQGVSRMREPNFYGGFNYFRTKLGQKNEWGQYYLTRNCVFEPSNKNIKDPVMHCLAAIDAAFRWKKPAIINTHRVNYIGSIFPENAKRSNKLLSRLLVNILKRWPDVEFCTSIELGKNFLADENT